MAVSAATHSPTQLEPAFLASGVFHWHSGRLELYRVNPPLGRMVAAIPVLIRGSETDWSRLSLSPGVRSEFAAGSDFLKANGKQAITLTIYARWMGIPFSLLGAWVAYRWSRELYGSSSGLITLVLYIFEPTLLAHGELITPDAPCTAMGLLAGYTFWRWLKSSTWRSAITAGACLGVAELTKLSWVILFVLWPLLWLMWQWLAPSSVTSPDENSAGSQMPPESTEASFHKTRAFVRRTQLLQLVFLLLSAVYVINVGYWFSGTGTALGNYEFFSESLAGKTRNDEPGNRFQHTILGSVPIPFPKPYIEGIDLQKKDFEEFPTRSFLRGEWRDGGWWHYYVYGLLIKIPCGTLALIVLVVVCRLFVRPRGADLRYEFVLLAPALALLVLVSSQTEFNIHLRYILPVFGILMVFLGQSNILLTLCLRSAMIRVQQLSNGTVKRALTRCGRPAPVAWLITGGLVIYSVGSLFTVYPYHLAYFNCLVGGPEGGYRHMLGSSFDWGQGLISVSDRMGEDRSLVGFLPAEDCALARTMDLRLRLPSSRDFRGAVQYEIRPPAIVSPNVLLAPDALLGTAEGSTASAELLIPENCSIHIVDGLLLVTGKQR